MRVAGEAWWEWLLVTPRLRAVILVAATLIWLANTVLPQFTRYQGENGIGVAVLGLYGVALGLPELARRRRDDDGDRADRADRADRSWPYPYPPPPEPPPSPPPPATGEYGEDT